MREGRKAEAIKNDCPVTIDGVVTEEPLDPIGHHGIRVHVAFENVF